MLEDLILEEQFRRARERDGRRAVMEEEARAAHRPDGLRTHIASALVTAGAWLDRRAVERVATVVRHPSRS